MEGRPAPLVEMLLTTPTSHGRLQLQIEVCVCMLIISVHAKFNKDCYTTIQVDTSPLPSPCCMSSFLYPFSDLITASPSCYMLTYTKHLIKFALKIFIYPPAFHSTPFVNRNGKRRSWKVKFVSIVITCQPCSNGLVQLCSLSLLY